MKLTAGEIYFVGERDFKTKEETPYVKIGIVREGAKGPRTSEERLLEHQTGNPRELFLRDVIVTPAVEEVETRLHKYFATEAVSGEWFIFTPDLLDAAIFEAKKLRDQAQENLFALEQSEILKKTLSNGKKLDAPEGAQKWHEMYALSSEIIKVAGKVKAQFETLMIESVEDIEDIDHIITKQTRKGSTFLNLERLEEVHPDICGKYLVAEQQFTQRFRITPKKISEFMDSVEQQEVFGLFDESEDMFEYPPLNEEERRVLHDRYLLVIAEESDAIWNKQIAEAQLKTLCGDYEAIEGICTWPRQNKERLVFDQEAFEAENPELVKEFTEKRPDVEATIVEPKKGY